MRIKRVPKSHEFQIASRRQVNLWNPKRVIKAEDDNEDDLRDCQGPGFLDSSCIVLAMLKKSGRMPEQQRMAVRDAPYPSQ